jgi:hypothetical protein
MSFNKVITFETGLFLAASASKVKDEVIETSMLKARAEASKAKARPQVKDFIVERLHYCR